MNIAPSHTMKHYIFFLGKNIFLKINIKLVEGFKIKTIAFLFLCLILRIILNNISFDN